MLLYVFMMSVWACVQIIMHWGSLQQHCNSPNWKTIDCSCKMSTTLLGFQTHLGVCSNNAFRYRKEVLETRISPSSCSCFQSVSYSDHGYGKLIFRGFIVWGVTRWRIFYPREQLSSCSLNIIEMLLIWAIWIQAEMLEPWFGCDNGNLTAN